MIDTKRIFWPLAAVVLLTATGCDTLREQAGLTKKAPDEFTVVTKAPLVIPPDFKLRPPRPGAKRPQEIQPADTARGALLGKAQVEASRKAGTGAASPSPVAATTSGNEEVGKQTSMGERALLRKAGADAADSSIREVVNRETTVLAEKDSSFTDRLIFWQKKQAYGSAVDAGKEAQRLREAAASGKAPNEGEVPVIKRRKRGWLEGIF